MNKKRLILYLTLILFFLIGTYIEMSAWAPYRVGLRTIEVNSSKIPDSFDDVSIANLSDINGNADNLSKAKKHFDKMKPDFLIFSGKLFGEETTEELTSQLKELLTSMDAPLGKFALLSPEDQENTRALLVEAGFTIVSNTSFEVYNKTSESILFNFYDASVFENLTNSDSLYTLGFSYDANLFESAKADQMDLFVGAKTLGGGINLPLFGSVNYDGITKKSSTLDGIRVLVNQGIGTPEPQLRLLSSPELLIINLNSIDNES